MKTYEVIIERVNGHFRASIPMSPNISAEAASRDEAVKLVEQAAEGYLSKVEVTRIEVGRAVETVGQSTAINPRSPLKWIESAGMFVGDEEAMLQHIEEIYAERKRQREEVEREYDRLDAAESGQ